MLGDQSTKLENRIYQGWEEYDAGNTNAIEDIYHELIPFCLRVCSKVCGRFINDNDEESSIAHLSILEAFSSYDPNKGKILVYLARVIRNRIIDFKRSEKKKQFLSLWEVDAALPIIQERQIDDIVEELARKQEIESLGQLLQAYNIKFSDLPRSSPRHNKTREEAKKISLKIASEPLYQSYLLEKKQLPIKMLEEREMINRKLVDRYRRYIIANALIIIYDFSYLKSYVLPS